MTDSAPTLEEALARPHERIVVDLACGDGRATARMAAREPHALIIGIDANLDAAERVIRLMDGRRSVDEIWTLCARLGSDLPSQDEIVRLLAELHRAEALAVDVGPDVRELLSRHHEQRAHDRRRRFGNPLAIRLRLFDPDTFLSRTVSFVRPLFGAWGGVVWLAVVGCWYGPAVARHGTAYLRETLLHQQVERYARSWVHHGPWYQYFGDFMTGFLPWSVFVPGALALAWRAWRRRVDAPAPGTINCCGGMMRMVFPSIAKTYRSVPAMNDSMIADCPNRRCTTATRSASDFGPRATDARLTPSDESSQTGLTTTGNGGRSCGWPLPIACRATRRSSANRVSPACTACTGCGGRR